MGYYAKVKPGAVCKQPMYDLRERDNRIVIPPARVKAWIVRKWQQGSGNIGYLTLILWQPCYITFISHKNDVVIIVKLLYRATNRRLVAL